MDASPANSQPPPATIFQLARLGDLAQTLPLIQRLSRTRQVRLICDKKTAEWARLLPEVQQVIPLDSRKWRAQCVGHLSELAGLLDHLEGEVSDLLQSDSDSFYVLNDFSLGDMLAVLCCRENHSRWVTPHLVLARSYLRLLASLHRWNRIHLADIWASLAETKAAGTVHPYLPSKAGARFAASVLRSSGPSDDRQVCALILGSGSPNRRIEPEVWASWLAALPGRKPPSVVGNRPQIALLGARGEENLAKRFLDLVGNGLSGVTNLVGKCSAEELIGVLAAVDLVIGVDTGPLHWAAAVGTKVLGFYFGEAGVHDTGPYGEGHLVLTPDCPDYPCLPQQAQVCGWKCRPAYGDSPAMPELLAAILRKESRAALPEAPGLRLYASRLRLQGNAYYPVGEEARRDEFESCVQFARRILGLSPCEVEDKLPNVCHGDQREKLETFYQVWKSEIEQLQFPAFIPRSVLGTAKNQALESLAAIRKLSGFHEYPAAKRRLFSTEPASARS